jgi:hypothetical protein
MWEHIVDLLELLGIIAHKKKKKQEKQLNLSETDDSTQKQDTSEEVTQQSGSICAGCNRILEKDAVYELGKPWCTECYKTHVLKIKG